MGSNGDIISSLENGSFVSGQDIVYLGIMKTIKKAKHKYQPLWEVITNAIEAIKDKGNQNETKTIKITFYYNTELIPDVLFFDRITIEDTGVGFNDENFKRFLRFNDCSKGNNNRGTGRFQVIHFFDTARYESVYKENNCYKKRAFLLSGKKEFLEKNAVVFYEKTEVVETNNTGTKVTLQTIKDKKILKTYSYDNMITGDLNKAIKEHYIPLFCTNKHMPNIEIKYMKDGVEEKKETISSKDFPKPNKSFATDINYTEYDSSQKEYVQIDDSERFVIDCFVFPKNDIPSNSINIICKGEVVPDFNMDFDFINKGDDIDGCRFLVYVSSLYFDDLVGNLRDQIEIPKRDEIDYEMLPSSDKVIFLEDINKAVNRKLQENYPAIAEAEKEYRKQIDKLKQMFLLDSNIVNQVLSTKKNKRTTEEQFLKGVYEQESANDAQRDIAIKNQMERLVSLDPTKNDYENQLKRIVSSVTALIPLSNRTDITRYVARRKLVLSLFEKTLKSQLDIQQNPKRNNDEKILHDILFKQGSSKPADSDLWLINEEYIYFNGTSNISLGEIKINGQYMFKEEARDINSIYFKEFKEHPMNKKPDVLLFPEEEKCIIIELKNPKENVAKHLNQINNYASLIFSYSSPCFHFQTFYGYLIGEGITSREVRLYDSEFKEAYRFGYLFRPHKTIISGEQNDSREGDLYTEVLNYSSLLKRAQIRNQIFIEKITKL